jgi:type VI secretion system Hcp family effector
MSIGRTKGIIWLCGMLALLPAVRAAASVDAYMTVVEGKQKPIAGETAKPVGLEGQIRLTWVTHQRGTAEAMTDRRQHNPITVTKQIDQFTPKLAHAMTSRENLSDVTIVYEGGGAGAAKEKAAQKIVLTDATITGIRNMGRTEEITLEYQKIEVTYVSGGKTAADDWTTQ